MDDSKESIEPGRTFAFDSSCGRYKNDIRQYLQEGRRAVNLAVVLENMRTVQVWSYVPHVLKAGFAKLGKLWEILQPKLTTLPDIKYVSCVNLMFAPAPCPVLFPRCRRI